MFRSTSACASFLSSSFLFFSFFLFFFLSVMRQAMWPVGKLSAPQTGGQPLQSGPGVLSVSPSTGCSDRWQTHLSNHNTTAASCELQHRETWRALSQIRDNVFRDYYYYFFFFLRTVVRFGSLRIAWCEPVRLSRCIWSQSDRSRACMNHTHTHTHTPHSCSSRRQKEQRAPSFQQTAALVAALAAVFTRTSQTSNSPLRNDARAAARVCPL